MDDTTADDTGDTTPNDTGDNSTVPEMSFDEKRRDQLLAAPDAVEEDAAPRIEVTEHDGNTRIDIAPDAAVRPGTAGDEP